MVTWLVNIELSSGFLFLLDCVDSFSVFIDSTLHLSSALAADFESVLVDEIVSLKDVPLFDFFGMV